MSDINGGESSPQTPSADDDKENASSNDKKEQKKKRMQDIIIVCILALVAFLIITFLASAPKFETRNKMTIVDGVIYTPANYYTYYTFSVPAGASNARVVGNYEVHGDGLTPRIDIYLANTTLCSSPIDCSSYYYVGKDKSFGKVDVYLPTSARSRQTTYYLSFYNIAPLGESKQTEASFKLEIS